jgi:hypothetical protein
MTGSDTPFHLGQPEHIDRVIAMLSAAGQRGQAELFRAVRAGEINVAIVGRQNPAPMKTIETSPRAVIVLIGDDDYQSTGPSGFVAWQRLSYWARAAMVHATGGDAASYRLAIAMAVMHQKFLLIETDSAHAHAWGDALRRRNIPAIGLLPRDGVHPAPPKRAETH